MAIKRVAIETTAEAYLTLLKSRGVDYFFANAGTIDEYPEGWAVRSKNIPLSDLAPSPAFELVAQASGAYAERVENPEALPDALCRAVKAVRVERRQGVLNVICRKPQ
jgi:acetolactate synthase-1/2/3 large subunit